jgi:hypothetical protein
MALPESLAAQLYLLGCRPERGRAPGGLEAAPRLRAAALAELWLAGLVRSDGARAADDPKSIVMPVRDAHHPDPVATALLAEIGARGKVRNWAWWVGHGERATERAVADQLAAAGTIELTRSRWLGIVPRTAVRLLDPAAVEQLRATVRQTLLGTTPVAELDRRELILAALAVAGEIKPLWDRAERRAARGRLDEIYADAGPVPPALRKVIRDKNSAIAAGATTAAVSGSTGC